MWVRAFVAVCLVAAGVLAAPTPQGTPPAVEAAALRAGDAAAYAITLDGGWIQAADVTEGPRYEVLPPQLVTRADGSRVHAFPVKTLQPATTLLPPEAGATWSTWSGTQWLDGLRVATQTDGANDLSGLAAAGQQAWSYPTRDEPVGDCLLTGPSPGAFMEWACDLPALRISLAAGARVRDLGVETSSRGALGHVQADDGVTRIDWWYAQGVSLPVRMAATAPGAPGLPPRHLELVLEGYLRGDGASEPLASSFAPAPLDWRPANRWGPDDSGIDVPFPLSAAFQAATQDPAWPELRQWLARHPQAWVFTAEPARDGLSWRLHLSDGEAGFSVAVQLTEAALPLGGPTVQVQRIETHPLYWAAAPRPDAMPSVASLWARWGDHAPKNVDANLWAFQALAGSQGPEIQYAAARAREIQWGVQGLEALGLGGSRSDTGVLLLDGDGQAVHFRHDAPASTGPAVAAPYVPVSMPYIPSQWAWAPAAGAGVAGLAVLLIAPKALLALFTRFAPAQLLEHPLRATIMDAVRAEPGLHFRALCDRLGANPGRVRHHVRKLVEGGHVIQRISPGYTCYFAHDGTSRGMLEAGPLLRSDGARHLVGAIVAHPGASARELALAAGLSPATTTYHLKRLQQAGLVAMRRDGRCVRLSLTPEGAHAAAVMG